MEGDYMNCSICKKSENSVGQLSQFEGKWLCKSCKVDFDLNKILIEHNSLNSTCWYCGKNHPDQKSRKKYPMYKYIDNISTTSGSASRYKQYTLELTRCSECRRIHENSSAIKYLFITFWLFSIVGILANMNSFSTFIKIIVFIGISLLFIVSGSLLIGRYEKSKNIKSGNSFDHPIVEKLSELGWESGKK
jgi:hypothetical protein